MSLALLSATCAAIVSVTVFRLMRSALPTGIANVAYDIRLETIAPRV